jgi:Putative endonuclease segE, GIY-YIG domain
MKKFIKIDGIPMEYFYDESLLDTEKYYGFVYVTKNIVEEKYYVGSSAFDKKNNHSLSRWENYLGSGSKLKKAITEQGRNNFKRIIIDLAEDVESLRELEKQYIEKFNATNKENCTIWLKELHCQPTK